jgi:hypothetical protein
VSGHVLSSGGVLIDINDHGGGMGDGDMAQANWQLDNPPALNTAASPRLGLLVVARLAARHGIRVRLRPGQVDGLTAAVWLPDEVISAAQPPSAPASSAAAPDTSAGTLATFAAAPARSAEEIRDRLAGFQRGLRRGREAVSSHDVEAGGDGDTGFRR